jgi:hypothetical protein
MPRHEWLADAQAVHELGHGELALRREDLQGAQPRHVTERAVE